MSRKSNQANLRVGCSGFSGSMASYFSLFNTVEVQQTFYQPPKIATLEKWRASAPRGFEFTIKAWQLVTHAASSPTYRRLKAPLTAEEAAGAGMFRDTEVVKSAWLTTVDCARALDAKGILLQCPASFEPLKQNLDNMRKFFAGLDRGGMEIYWEPRGDAWTQAIVRRLCDELNVFHAVDPFVSSCQTADHTYFRMHGKTGWRYVYTDKELSEIKGMLPKAGSAFVFFNNVSMRDDALRFEAMK